MTNVDPEHLQTLRHMLGIEEPDVREPKPYRDYYCASPCNAKLGALERLGLVECYARIDGYEWYRCTPAGRSVALASHRTIRWPKGRRVYYRFLEVRDAYSDLTFRDFLTRPEFAQTRRDA